jgi:methylated-DNA-[protein]-cysteine S-methyltransferase
MDSNCIEPTMSGEVVVSGGAGTRTSALHFVLLDTAIGCCGIAWSASGLARLRLPEVDRHMLERRLAQSARACPRAPPPHIARLAGDLQRYAAGDKVDFTAVVLDLAGVAPFDRQVYAAARAVGWGCTITYGELARRAGLSAPEAAREVGQSLARNPVPIVIPCHRVVAGGNRLGGFSAPGGRSAKERLLALEGVRLDGRQLALPGL